MASCQMETATAPCTKYIMASTFLNSPFLFISTELHLESATVLFQNKVDLILDLKHMFSATSFKRNALNLYFSCYKPTNL
jgi:hypothetical protein